MLEFGTFVLGRSRDNNDCLCFFMWTFEEFMEGRGGNPERIILNCNKKISFGFLFFLMDRLDLHS